MKYHYLIAVLLLSACINTPQTSIAPENKLENTNTTAVNIDNKPGDTIVHVENKLPEMPAPGDLKITDIRTAQREITLAQGEQKQLVAEVILSDGSINREIDWISSNTLQVSVSSTGIIHRLAPGTVKVTAISRLDSSISLEIQIADTPAAGSKVPPVVLPTESIPPDMLPEPLPTPGPLPEPNLSDMPAPSPVPAVSPSASGATSIPTAAPTPTPTPNPTPSPTSTPEALPISTLGMTFANIPDGSFMMGQTGIAEPVHAVTISAFQMQTTEVTQKQWWDVMGSWPGTAPSSSNGVGDNYPMYYVSWCDIVGASGDPVNCSSVPVGESFLDRLNTNYSGTYRLPTEAEWEYAARAGTTSPYACGEYVAGANGCPGSMAWFHQNNSPSGSKPVKTKQANAWGLHDMHGNVSELVQDWNSGNWYQESVGGQHPRTNPTGPESGLLRGVRGGFWNMSHGVNSLQTAVRNIGMQPESRVHYIGFRVVRTP